MFRGRLLLGLSMFVVSVVALGCATAPVAEPAPILTSSKTFDADYDDVWNALVTGLSDRGHPIQSTDKSSGLIQFTLAYEEKFLGVLLGVERTIDRYAHRPTRILAVWDRLEIFASVKVSKHTPGQTMVKVTPIIRGRNNLIGWEELRSKGTVEKDILGWIEEGLKAKRGK